jgi:hypothetical protein
MLPSFVISMQAAASKSILQVGAHAAQLVKDTEAHETVHNSSASDRLCKVLHAWSAPVSPHLAVQNEGGKQNVECACIALVRTFYTT